MSTTDLGAQRRKRDADEHGNSRWTVRDMLVDALEEIDSGEKARLLSEMT